MAYFYRTIRRSDESRLMQWGEFFLVIDESQDSNETCSQFVHRVLFHHYVGSNSHLPLGGTQLEGCFYRDRQSAERWFEIAIARGLNG